ncbi:MAG TPA: hypothetical protein VN688_09690 [Gemmataceae bacterium]|nr:hypothetical protein [Gemmataceae bacterium]
MTRTHQPARPQGPWGTRSLVCAALLVALAVGAGIGTADDQPKTVLKTESFDKDPGWEGHNNHVVPQRLPTVVQDFGYSKTNFAGEEKGEIGGQVMRASKPAYYADTIGPVTLDNKLSASGTFALTKTAPGGGIFFGFFRAEQLSAGGRPTGSLGMNMDCERSGARLAVRLITGRNQSCGTFVTPFIPGKFRPTPIRNDGTRYQWTLDYDPEGAGGRGQFKFTIRGEAPKPGEFSKADIPESHKKEARRRFPDVTAFTVDLPEGYRKQGATFDHFGLMNMMKPGGSMSIFFDNLKYLGRTQAFSQDPKWDASGNRTTYQSKDVGGAHDFGFSPTNHAGCKVGEVGGTFWRSGKYAYYADKVGPLTLDDRLAASGKVVLKVGAPDADMFLGWFNSANKEKPPVEAGHFLGVHVGGPTRVGHYFHPSLMTAKGIRFQAAAGPILTPGKVYDWSLIYDPAAEGGNGAITITLDKEAVTLPLKKGIKTQGASFDRFGLFTSNIGGQIVRIYLDDLKYTATRPAP